MDNSFTPVFTLKLKYKIIEGLVTVGKYDGKHPCLTCATSASKVFVHNPYSSQSSGGRISIEDSDISLLTINQSVTSLKAGKLNPAIDRDVLCIGTQTNLLAYDVHNNTDLFYKQVLDGVNSLAIGMIKSCNSPLVVAGGNCTLQGFDSSGEDKFWTVTGDIVTSLVITDMSQDAQNQLIVGSEDFDIRIFNGDAIIGEISENEAVTHLCKISATKFGYGLVNGTVGVYDGSTRIWRIKSKQRITSMQCFDVTGDGNDELVCGWSNGKIDARSMETGDVVFKDSMQNCIAGLIVADYRLDGTLQLIACSVDGEVRGYQRSDVVDTSDNSDQLNQQVKELSLFKQNLLLEIENYEKEISSLNSNTFYSYSERVENAIIPTSTAVSAKLHISQGTKSHPDPHLQLLVFTNNDTIIKTVVLFAEGLFDGESQVVHPPNSQLSNVIEIPLHPNKDVPLELHIQAFIGLPESKHFHVFELTKKVPSFSSYLYVKELPVQLPDSYVHFNCNERIQRVAIWVSEEFLLPHQVEYVDDELKVNFLCVRGGLLQIHMDLNGVRITTEDIEIAGSIIQSLCSALSINQLQSEASFPQYMQKVEETMSFIDNVQSSAKKITAEMSEQSNLIKSFIVRTEDSRIIEDIEGMRRGLVELQQMSNVVVNSYKIRCSNHQQLVEGLKFVNQLIQKCAQLRVGKFKTQVISQCREAIKNNQTATLIKIMQNGSS